MEFKIVKYLSEGETKEQHDINLPQYVTRFFSSKVDSKGVYRADVDLKREEEKLVDLGYYFDEDVIIYGTGDIITTVDTLKELGLI